MSRAPDQLDHLKLLQRKRLALLKEKRKRAGITPLNSIREHDKQLLLTLSSKINRWFLGGNRTGKTEWGAHECARFLHKRHPAIPLASEMYKGRNIEGWACAVSYDLQEDTTQPKLLALLDENRILDTQKLRGDILLKLVYKADDGTRSTVHFKSYDQGRAKFQGAGKNFIWFDEEPPKEIYDEAAMRSKAGYPLYTFCTMTPVNGMTWVYDDIYLATSDPNLLVVTAEWDDNCFLSAEQKEQMASRYTEAALQVRRRGLFVQRTGLVCPWWRRDVHLLPPDKILERIPKGSDVYCGIDFGFSAPFACVYVAVDHDDNHYIIDGFYKRFLQNPQAADLMKRKEKAIAEAGLVLRTRYGDSANPSDIAELTTLGLPVVPVKKERGESREGWDEHRARLMDVQGKISPVTGQPKLFVSSALIEINEDAKRDQREFNWFVSEIENLRWHEIRTTQGSQQKPMWSEKSKKHAMDAYSYMLTMYAAPPESPEEERRRRAQEYARDDEMVDSGWVACMGGALDGFLLPSLA